MACKYRTGRTLGQGAFAVVKEAIHMETSHIFAAKVINKKLMEGRDRMVRNEIAVLKKISGGHRNIVSLHDYFETKNNVYLIFDLCSGGRLLDRVCARGGYCELDAVVLVRSIFDALAFIHSCGIVHRDLKPENLLFRTPDENSDIMIADFGLSRVLDDDRLHRWTEVCGTPSYMAPEIYMKRGYGPGVDVWAMGVVTYMLLTGQTPFERTTREEEIESIIAGDYKFEPKEVWLKASAAAQDFIRQCLTNTTEKRPSAAEMCKHAWLTEEILGNPEDLLPHIKKAFGISTNRKIRLMMKRMQGIASGSLDSSMKKLQEELQQYKKQSEEEIMENENIMHLHHSSPHTPQESQLADAKLEKKARQKEKTNHLKNVDDLNVDNHIKNGDKDSEKSKEKLDKFDKKIDREKRKMEEREAARLENR